MKTLYWSSQHPLDVWDNPNCFFDAQGIGRRREEFDEGYIPWFPPGYTPPASKPKPKKKRRRPHSPTNTNTNPTTTHIAMDNYFHFNVVPKSGGGNTTRCVTQEPMYTPELVAATQAALTARGITLTDEQIIAVGEESSKVRVLALAKSRPVRRAFGYFTDEPTSGGSHDDPDFTPTVDNMNAGSRGRLAPLGQELFDSVVTFHRDGVKGDKVPTITRVYDGTTRELDQITLGGPFRISGPGEFGPEPTPGVTTLGFFLERTGGTPVRIGAFSDWTGSEIRGAWPAAISGTGTVELRLVVQYPGNSDLSTFIYGTPLTIVP